jgi:hypothetical protein
MELKLLPNWSSPAQGYIDVPGTYTTYQLNVPSSGNLWFFSNVQFVIGSVIRITQATAGTYNAKINDVYFSIFGWNIVVEPINGTADLSAITQIEEPYYDEGAFQLDGVIEILLNFRIFDLKELKRSSTFTKTVDIPFTKNNDKIFTQIFNINVTNGFNPKKKSDCTITDGGILIASGYLQVQEIDLPNKLYKCVFYGETKNLFDDIGDKFVFGNSDRADNLNFDDTVHNKVKSEIEASWNNQRDYVYTMIKTNTNQITSGEINTTGIPTTKLYPQLRVKYVIDKIFAKWGYEYDSNFFNSDLFKDLLIMPSFEKPTGDAFVEYQASTNYRIYEREILKIPFTTQIVDQYGNSYNSGTGRFKIPFRDRFTLSCGFGFLWGWGTYNDPNVARNRVGNLRLLCNIWRRGLRIVTNLNLGQVDELIDIDPNNVSQVYNNDTDGLTLNHVPIPFDFLAEDEIEFFLNLPKTGIEGDVQIPFFSGTASYLMTDNSSINIHNDNYTPWLAIENELFSTNLLPTFLNVKQVDIIGDVIKMFNLYIKPDKTNSRKFIIEPRDDFYKRGKTVTNLNYDVNSVQISYLNDLAARKYLFSYASDNDYANKTFQDANKGRIYGDAQIELDNDFLNNERKISLVAAPTQFTPRPEFLNVTLPSIQNEDLTKATTSFKTRYWWYCGQEQARIVSASFSVPTTIKFKLNTTATQSAVFTYSNFPATSNNYSYGDRTSDSLLFAINGGTTKENSLYYNYYENEIETYADQNSHILTLEVELNTKILQSIDFNDLFYFEIGGNSQYYTLLSIDNYDPTQTTMATMKFLTYYDFRSAKPKRNRFIDTGGYVGQVGIGDIGIKPGDLYPDLGGGVKGGGSNTGDGIGTIKNGLFTGTNNAFAGDNETIILNGDNNIFADSVQKAFVFGDNNNIESSNIVTFDSGKTYSTANQFAFGDFNPVLGQRDINTFTNSTDGMMVWGGTSQGLYVYGGGTFSYIGGGTQGVIGGSSGSSGSSGSDGTSGTSGTSPTIDTYQWFLSTNQKFATASTYFNLDTWTDSTGGTWFVSAQVYTGATAGSGDIQQTMSVRISDGGGVTYASAESNVNFPLNAYTTINLSTIVTTSAGNQVVLEIASNGASGFQVFNSLETNPTADKSTQWNIFRLSY